MRWCDKGWQVRDLGSRNGTFLDGRRLVEGRWYALTTGMSLTFGVASCLYMTCDSSPEAAAVSAYGEIRVAARGMLVLPDAAHPEVTILLGPHGWQCETASDTVRVHDGQQLMLDGMPWTLRLPDLLVATEDVDSSAASVPSIYQDRLQLEVTSDEEHVSARLVGAQNVLELGTRTHHYLLLTLARRYARDREAGESPTMCGWVHQSELARMLRLADSQINLQIFRLRKQLSDASVEGAIDVIERRLRTRLLRIGTPCFDITQLV